jgi:hypothetical protein
MVSQAGVREGIGAREWKEQVNGPGQQVRRIGEVPGSSAPHVDIVSRSSDSKRHLCGNPSHSRQIVRGRIIQLQYLSTVRQFVL